MNETKAELVRKLTLANLEIKNLRAKLADKNREKGFIRKAAQKIAEVIKKIW